MVIFLSICMKKNWNYRKEKGCLLTGSYPYLMIIRWMDITIMNSIANHNILSNNHISKLLQLCISTRNKRIWICHLINNNIITKDSTIITMVTCHHQWINNFHMVYHLMDYLQMHYHQTCGSIRWIQIWIGITCHRRRWWMEIHIKQMVMEVKHKD